MTIMAKRQKKTPETPAPTPPPAPSPDVRFIFRLSADLRDRMESHASRIGLNASAWLRMVLIRELEREEKKSAK